ncbi:MAG TPA: head protein [Myxococcaceae bacterium]|jgi:hypothetical protein
MSIHDLLLDVQGLLGRTMKGAQSPEEKELFRVATAALMFISETGAVSAFEDYLQFRRGGPPYAVAAFKTPEEAEAWLHQHKEPPHGAFVLIADSYHIVMSVREMNHRRLLPHPILEAYLRELQREAPTDTLAAFSTREEGVAWLQAQPEPPQRVYLAISGKPHVALYHRNMNHWALYPLSPEPEAPGV